MTEEFKKIGQSAVFKDKARGGLLTKFLIQYKEQFGGGKLNPSCSSCRNKYWSNYLKLFEMKQEVKCDYVLHKKYNGIQLGFSGRPVRNGEMTNEIAKELLEKHPKGAGLFSVIPEKTDELEVKEAKEVKRKPRKRKK